eukprot:735541-Pelagomonas_calceolata.AAC.1
MEWKDPVLSLPIGTAGTAPRNINGYNRDVFQPAGRLADWLVAGTQPTSNRSIKKVRKRGELCTQPDLTCATGTSFANAAQLS